MSQAKSKRAWRAGTLGRDMPDLHRTVARRMKELKWSTYKLVKELKGKRPDGSDIPAQTVYEFVRGETLINHRDLGIIFDVLGLDVSKAK